MTIKDQLIVSWKVIKNVYERISEKRKVLHTLVCSKFSMQSFFVACCFVCLPLIDALHRVFFKELPVVSSNYRIKSFMYFV